MGEGFEGETFSELQPILRLSFESELLTEELTTLKLALKVALLSPEQHFTLEIHPEAIKKNFTNLSVWQIHT